MNIVKCKSGHFYDADVFENCPSCDEHSDSSDTRKEFSESKTVSIDYKKEIDLSNQLTESYFENVMSSDKTISLNMIKGNRKIAGWIIGINNDYIGKSFNIYVGQNFIGRAKDMDIVINGDTVSRENHCNIVYDPKSNVFAIVRMNGIVYCNSKLLEGHCALKENDRIEVSENKFVFVPFCNEERNWNEKNN